MIGTIVITCDMWASCAWYGSVASESSYGILFITYLYMCTTHMSMYVIHVVCMRGCASHHAVCTIVSLVTSLAQCTIITVCSVV